MKNQIEIHFDGGCRPTNPGNKYGSYEVMLENKPVFKASRVEFGWGTNNEAEFNSLIAALEFTTKSLLGAGLPPEHYSVAMFSDSMILCNRVRLRNCGGKGEAGRRMGKLTRQVLAHLTLFKLWTINWNGRETNVKRFGH